MYLIGKDGMLPDTEMLLAFDYLIGKDGTSPDSEKSGGLWVFDRKAYLKLQHMSQTITRSFQDNVQQTQIGQGDTSSFSFCSNAAGRHLFFSNEFPIYELSTHRVAVTRGTRTTAGQESH